MNHVLVGIKKDISAYVHTRPRRRVSVAIVLKFHTDRGVYMKAIILAAGPGKRLRPHTNDRPKCMVDINGKTTMDRFIDAFHQNDIDDIIVVTG